MAPCSINFRPSSPLDRCGPGNCQRDRRPVLLCEPERVPAAEGPDRDRYAREEGPGDGPHGKLPGPLPDFPGHCRWSLQP